MRAVILYLKWHFVDAPKSLLKAFKNFLLFNLNYFSVGLLLKTFFSPWRRYREPYGRGFDLKRYLEAFLFNMLSRIIGGVVRSFLIITGAALEILIFVAGVFILCGFFLWPALLTALTGIVFVYLPSPGFAEMFSAVSEIISFRLFFGSVCFAVLFIDLMVFYCVIKNFINTKLRRPELKATLSQAVAEPKSYDLTQFLSYEPLLSVKKAIKEAGRSKKEPDSNLLFYFLLKYNPSLSFVFSRALLDIKEIQNNLLKEFLAKSAVIYQSKEQSVEPELQTIILQVLKIAEKKGRSRATKGDLFSVLVKNNVFFQKILVQADLKSEDIADLADWLEEIEAVIAKRKKFWEWENLLRFGSIGREWAAGYTITLDQYSRDLTKSLKATLPEIVGHKEELETTERILSQREINNVLLVGEVGSGRRSIVHGLAVKSVLGRCSPQINYKRIVQLDLPSLFARTATTEQAETILDTIFEEVVRAGNVILVIDEFHNFIGFGRERPGALDISGILGSYLSLPQFQLIAISDFAGLHRNIEQAPSILALFQKVVVSEISPQECLLFLEKATPSLEKIYKRFVSFPALKEIIALSDKYIADLPFPKKAMDLLDETMVFVAKNPKEKVVLPGHVAEVVRQKTKIPVGELESEEKKVLLDLENLIGRRLVNQAEAVKEVSEALRRARAGIATRKGPMGSFLFLGPTGVGKTETAKTLAEIYFGSENRMIRLDMSEFQAVADIPRLLGSPGQEGLLTTGVRENPFSLILLDELEKAHPNILNLFLQVLDEGHITDGLGRKIDFKNTIIIATSNAGFQIILEALKQKTEWGRVKEKILDFLFSQAIFRPEFINRFDAVVLFRSLNKENLLNIAGLMLAKLQKNLKAKYIDFLLTESLKEKLVELGYSPIFGARQMRRVLQDRVENPLARALLSGELKRGNKVEVNSKTFQLRIT